MSVDPLVSDRLVNFVVGGAYHSLLLSDIARHKDSYFASVIKDEWSGSSQAPIVINRDGAAFQHILNYIYLGIFKLPNRLRIHRDSLSLVIAIRADADYYNLPDLVHICEKEIKAMLPGWCAQLPYYKLYDHYECMWQGVAPNELSSVYLRNFFSNVQTGNLNDRPILGHIFKSSVVGNINVPEILASSEVTKVNCAMSRVEYFHLDGFLTLDTIESRLPGLQNIRCCRNRPDLVVITKRDQVEIPAVGPRRQEEIGIVYFILQAATSGGAISVTQNGITQTISQPGEFMVCGCDVHRVVSAIDSGELVFLLFSMNLPGYDSDFVLVTNNRGSQDLTCELEQELVTATHNELTASNTVVLCLSQLYPISALDPSSLQMETDPDALRGRDMLLHEALAKHFEVTLVTVYVQRYQNENVGCVIGPAPNSGAKVKIITPPYGFGHIWKEKVGNVEKFATLFTGLQLKAKL